MEKITYASLGSLGEEFHRTFETALMLVRKRLGESYPIFVNGRALKSPAGTFVDLSPSDERIELGLFQSGTREQVRKAISAAQGGLPIWNELGWQQRVAFLRKVADLMNRRQMELAAVISLEVGKNRFEAIAEVAESVDLILYYCQQMELRRGYIIPMVNSGTEQTRSVLRPYGVWAIVSPFNFPLALATGMATGALLGGNTVVFKPSSEAPWAGLRLYELFHEAGLPVGVFNLVTGPGAEVGEELITNPGIGGIAFTGSRAVGLEILQRFSQAGPRPCVVEMGGKNPAIVMPSADLEAAAEGVVRAAFGMGGQKCSACSRVYLHHKIREAFLELLVEKTRALKVGDPQDRHTFLGPLINTAAVDRFQTAVKMAKREGRLVCGGRVLNHGELAHGHFVEPAIVDGLRPKSRLFREEFFAPFLAVATVKSLDGAIQLANDSEYGLTAGLFSRYPEEQAQFFGQIEAGVAYCNRRGGATTGAWPGVQSFGGWKQSGSGGKNALGPLYLSQFMREQSQTLCG